MEDFLKRPLAVGDYVVFLQPYNRNFLLGRIVSFSAKQARIEYNNPDPRSGITMISRYPSDLVRVNGPDLTVYLLKR